MVSPMREKRTWPPQDKDSDGETVAAFEAAVAVIKETVVRSGEVLVSAREDLSDHQRWLKAQTARVAADRERHNRFLQRQRERQEALLRREQKRAQRRARREAVSRSIKQGVSATSFAVHSAIWLVVAKTVAGLNSIDAAAVSGLRWLGVKVRDVALYVARANWQGLSFAGRELRALGLAAASGLRRLGVKVRDIALYVARAMWQGLSFAGRKLRALGLTVWMLLSAGAAKITAQVQAMAPAVGNFLSLCFGGLAARAHDASRSINRGLGVGLSGLSAKTDELARSAGEALGSGLSAIAARSHALAPALTERIVQAGHAAGYHAKGGAQHVQSLLARTKIRGAAEAPPVEGENAVSLPRAGKVDLSQMLIIAGALLLVCGGLMLVGGLMLRAGTPSPLVAAEPNEPIAWLYEHPSLPLDERSVFVFNATPEGLRIKGFSIGGVNLSDQSLGSLDGVIKPDGRDHDLALALSVEPPEAVSEGAEASKAQPVAVLPEGAIPSQAPFKLAFLFPAEANGGMTPQEVLSTFGGLMLKVHYEMDGKQRSFIQYLPASLLEEQLAEIAKGS
jgi:hypothetical protein